MSSDDVRQIFIAFDVPKEVHAFHASVQPLVQKYVWRKHVTPAHITVKAPFIVSPRKHHAVRTLLQDLIETRRITACRMQLGPIDIFPRTGAIHLPVAGFELHQAILTVIKVLRDEMDIGVARYEGERPHITLVKPEKKHRKTVMEIVEKVSQRPSGWYTCQHMHVFSRPAPVPDAVEREPWTETEVLTMMT